MAPRGQLQNILWAQKLSNLKSEIIQILLSHSPPYGLFQGFTEIQKWPPRINFNFLVGAKTQKISSVNFFKF